MKASQIVKGTRAVHRIKYPAADGTEIDIGVRALTGSELAEVLSESIAFVKSKDGEPAPHGDLYDLGIAAHTLAVACVDPDDGSLFFDGGFQQVLDLEWLGRDGIAYLYEVQEDWQSQVSPQKTELSDREFASITAAMLGKDGRDFFFQLRPGLRWSLVRFMAALALNSLDLKSDSGFMQDSKFGKSIM